MWLSRTNLRFYYKRTRSHCNHLSCRGSLLSYTENRYFDRCRCQSGNSAAAFYQKKWTHCFYYRYQKQWDHRKGIFQLHLSSLIWAYSPESRILHNIKSSLHQKIFFSIYRYFLIQVKWTFTIRFATCSWTQSLRDLSVGAFNSHWHKHPPLTHRLVLCTLEAGGMLLCVQTP